MVERANKENIWRTRIYLPYVNEPLTDEAVLKAEMDLGQKIPIEYLELLGVQNGGHIAWGLKGTCHECLHGIGEHFPRLSPFHWDEYEIDLLKGLGNTLVPFDGDGHWLICLDYRRLGEKPCISYIDTESQTPQIKVLFKDFSHYLANLQRAELNDGLNLGITNPIPSHELIEEVAKLCGFEVDKKINTFAAGYPIYRAGEMRGEQGYWVFVSPNLVPRTFVRPDDYQENPQRFDRLKQRFPGAVYRYAKHPEVMHVIRATDAAMPMVKQAVITMGLAFREL